MIFDHNGQAVNTAVQCVYLLEVFSGAVMAAAPRIVPPPHLRRRDGIPN